MKRRNLFLIASLFLTFLPVLVLAQNQPYVPLEPLPFFTTANPSFPQYLQAAFRLAVLAGAALAVLMLTLGGVQYMTSDVLGQKEQGRSRIKNALLGFLLLLAIVTILETINPNLLKFQLITQMVGRVPDATPTTPTTGTPPGQTPTPISPEAARGLTDSYIFNYADSPTPGRIDIQTLYFRDQAACQAYLASGVGQTRAARTRQLTGGTEAGCGRASGPGT